MISKETKIGALSMLRMASTRFKGSTLMMKGCYGMLLEVVASCWPSLVGCGSLLASCSLLQPTVAYSG